MPRKQPAKLKYHPSPYAILFPEESHFDLLADLLLEKNEKLAVRNLKRMRRKISSFPEIAKLLGLAPAKRPGRPRGSRRKFELESVLVAIAVDWCGVTRREFMRAYRRYSNLDKLEPPDHHWFTRHIDAGRPLVLDFLKDEKWVAIKSYFDSLTPGERKEEGKRIPRALRNPA